MCGNRTIFPRQNICVKRIMIFKTIIVAIIVLYMPIPEPSVPLALENSTIRNPLPHDSDDAGFRLCFVKTSPLPAADEHLDTDV